MSGPRRSIIPRSYFPFADRVQYRPTSGASPVGYWRHAIAAPLQERLLMPSTLAKVLIVEDDDSIRTLYAQALTQCGYQVQSAGDGFSALAEVRKQVPDVIVS